MVRDPQGLIRAGSWRRAGRARFSEGGSLSIPNGENRRSKGPEAGEAGEPTETAPCTGW